MAKITIGEGISTKQKEDLLALAETLGRDRNYPDFIQAYMNYTQDIEATDKIRRWTALSIIAAALERKVHFSQKKFLIFPNLYTIIVAGSGIGKSVSTNVGVDLLRELGGINFMSERLTAGSLIEQLKRSNSEYSCNGLQVKQSSIFAYASELKVLLSEVYGSISELLTTFYDSIPYDSSKPWIYETKGAGQTKIFGPCLNILGASTSAWLTQAIPPSEMEGGFASRVMFVVEKNLPDHFAPFVEENAEVEAMKPRLVADLKQIHALRGAFTLTPEAREFYKEWYIKDRTEAGKNTDARFEGYFGRKRTTLIKLAMLIAVSRGSALLITPEHLTEALDYMQDLELSMLDAFGATGKNKLAEGVYKIKEMVRSRKHIAHKELLRAFWRDYSGSEISQILDDLSRMQLIRIEQAGSDIRYHWLKEKD